jgi:NADH dehydrogenase [ubiquinone] 1 alpha subcomplex assembly factor 7
MPFARELIGHITKHGPITVADYMARCNAQYYATRDPFGSTGDFITAPEISQIFGELMGAWLANAWIEMGSPKALLCELGPGRGTLMKDALRATRGVTGFHGALSLRLVETSPHLKAIQQKTLSGSHSRILWQETLDDLPPLPLLLIANEFFDALPVRQFIRAGLEEQERYIACEGKKLAWHPPGNIIRETSPMSLDITSRIAAHIHTYGGAALIIDYGYAGGTHADTLQAVRAHAYADPLEASGEADLTVHVDFAALSSAARKNGAYAYGPVEQGIFLKRLGAELRAHALCKAASPKQREAILSGLERLVAPHQMGRLFKALAVTSSLETPAGF